MDSRITIRRTTLVIIFSALSAAFRTAACGAATPVNLTTSAPAPAARLATVSIDGATAYAAPRLFAAYRDQLGGSITREQMRAIAVAVTELYAADGFVKPEVTVDETLSGNGLLRFTVHEARVTRVVFESDTDGRYRDTLAGVAQRLENARPLRRDDIPRALREMRAVAGLTVTANTRRDPATRNGFELVVKTDFSPVDGVVRMNNRGTDQVGPNFLLGQFFLNGLLGRQEKIGLVFAAATNTDEYLGGGLFADTALGHGGTRANLLLFRSRSAPNEAPVNLDDRYTRERAVLRVTRPLRPDGTFTLSASGAFEADDLTIDENGETIREDRLRIVETALRGSYRTDGGTQLSANLQLRKGLDALGGGLEAYDLADDPRRADFLLTQLQATASRRFATRWSTRLDLFAQHSGYVLPDSERFKIGGDRLGRGFEVAEIAGDRGLGAKLELRRDLVDTTGFAGRLSSYGFYDIGAAWKQDRPGRESAATAGLGLALAGASLTGYLEVAAPLTGPDIEGRRDASVFAELAWRF